MEGSDLKITRASLIYWLPSICFVLHTIEEIPGFAHWVTEHFKPYTTEHFVYSHIPLIWLGLCTSFFAITKPNVVFWRMLAVAWQIQFGLNALFHIFTTVHFNEYAPGLLTAVGLNIPATAFVLHSVLKESLITRIQLMVSILIGGIVAILAICSLL